jgi:hypothetical protein
MLSQLADMARAAEERRLELAIRLLAVEAAGGRERQPTTAQNEPG